MRVPVDVSQPRRRLRHERRVRDRLIARQLRMDQERRASKHSHGRLAVLTIGEEL